MSSPTPSTFAELNLNRDINKALESCGYKHPTPVQAQSIPPIMGGKDVVVSAQTGTGKTAAFVLPALNLLSLQKPTKKPRILILTPTRELATQVTKAAGLYGKFLRFNIISLVGGMSYHHQIKDLARGADVIVATPGRLLDHMDQKRVDLSGIEMLILDEADRMLDMGFIEDVEYIAKLTPTHRQTLLFSATVDNKLTGVVKHLLKNPVRINLSEKLMAAPLIKQEMYKVQNPPAKGRLLKQLLADEQIFKAIIFSATKIGADKIALQLRDQGFAASALHGDLKQNVRNRTLDQFRQGKVQFLVATDVAARGIDIGDITHVINYDLPRFCEDYVHRIGRTGRAGKTGIAISFVLPADLRHLQKIERFTGQRLSLIQHRDSQKNDEPIARHEADEHPRGGEKEWKKSSHAPRKQGRDNFSAKKSSKPRGERFNDHAERKRPEESYRQEEKPARRQKPFREERSSGHERSSYRADKPERSAYREDKPAARTRGGAPFRQERSRDNERDTYRQERKKPVRDVSEKESSYEKRAKPRKDTYRTERSPTTDTPVRFKNKTAEKKPRRTDKPASTGKPSYAKKKEKDASFLPFKKRSEGKTRHDK